MFEDDVPFPKVGYVSSLEGTVRFVECSIEIEGKRLLRKPRGWKILEAKHLLGQQKQTSIHRGTRFLYIYEPVWSQKGPKNVFFSYGQKQHI